MKNKAKLAIILTLTIQGCAMERTISKATDSRACVANFSTEGGFWTGKQFKTFEDFPSISKASAFDSLITTITSSGYQILNSNKDIGIISANQTVSYGQGKTVPLNAVVKKNASGGIRVQLAFSLSGGLVTSSDSIQEEFCKILSSVNLSKDEPIVATEESTPAVVLEPKAKAKATTKNKRKPRNP